MLSPSEEYVGKEKHVVLRYIGCKHGKEKSKTAR